MSIALAVGSMMTIVSAPFSTIFFAYVMLNSVARFISAVAKSSSVMIAMNQSSPFMCCARENGPSILAMTGIFVPYLSARILIALQIVATLPRLMSKSLSLSISDMSFTQWLLTDGCCSFVPGLMPQPKNSASALMSKGTRTASKPIIV